ncbi:MAG: hypothetical protein NXY57DRAFT_979324 [Lentinula lateritia]|nr:MAG: hypothetical protein NXY57DRAFT_979324 [Lentinula lateritia]
MVGLRRKQATKKTNERHIIRYRRQDQNHGLISLHIGSMFPIFLFMTLCFLHPFSFPSPSSHFPATHICCPDLFDHRINLYLHTNLLQPLRCNNQRTQFIQYISLLYDTWCYLYLVHSSPRSWLRNGGLRRLKQLSLSLSLLSEPTI